MSCFKYIPNLTKLTLYQNEFSITNKGLKLIPKIESLEIKNSDITDDGLIYIPNIHTLDLGYSEITNNGLKYIPNIHYHYAIIKL